MSQAERALQNSKRGGGSLDRKDPEEGSENIDDMRSGLNFATTAGNQRNVENLHTPKIQAPKVIPILNFNQPAN
jgi:hypothetical protein